MSPARAVPRWLKAPELAARSGLLGPFVPPVRLRGAAPVGVELFEEQGAAVGLVGFADAGRHHAQPIERAQEPAIRLVPPPHVPRPAPTGAAQRVEATVVPDAVIGVGLDV